MSYFAVAYPKMDKTDHEWIQNIRRVNDTDFYHIVQPHFTVIFGTDKLPLDEFLALVKLALSSVSAFDVTLHKAKVVKNDFKQSYQCFLVPKNGYKQIQHIHNVLYKGALETELRHDIPYIPHVSVGSSTDELKMSRLADAINKDNKTISGRVDTITIVKFDGTSVSNLRSIPLR